MAEGPTIIFSTRPWFAYPRKLGSGSRGLAQDDSGMRGSRCRRHECRLKGLLQPPDGYVIEGLSLQCWPLVAATVFLFCHAKSFDILMPWIVSGCRQDLDRGFSSRGRPLRAAEQFLRPSRNRLLQLLDSDAMLGPQDGTSRGEGFMVRLPRARSR